MSTASALVTDPRTVTDWVMEQQGEIPEARPLQGLGWAREGRMVAGLIWENFTGSDVTAHASCVDGAMPRPWLVAVAQALFGPGLPGLKRVSFPIVEGNERCIALAQRFGAVFDYRITDGRRDGDVLVYCLRRNTGFHQRLLAAGLIKD